MRTTPSLSARLCTAAPATVALRLLRAPCLRSNPCSLPRHGIYTPSSPPSRPRLYASAAAPAAAAGPASRPAPGAKRKPGPPPRPPPTPPDPVVFREPAKRRKKTMEARAYNRWTKEALVERILQLEHAHAEPTRAHDGDTTTTTTNNDNNNNKNKNSNSGDDPAAAAPPQKKRPDRQMNASRYSTRLVALKLAYVGKQYGGFEYQASGSLPTIEEELWKALVRSCLINPDPAVAHEVRFEDPALEYSKCGRTDRGVNAYGQVIALRMRSNRPPPPKPTTTTQTEGVAAGAEDAAAAPESEGADAQQPPPEETDALAAELPAFEAAGDDGEGFGASLGPEPDQEADSAAAAAAPPFDDFSDEIQYCRVLNRLLPADIRILAWCPTTQAGFSARHHCRERQYRYYFTNPAFAPLPAGLIDPAAPRRRRLGGKGQEEGGEIREGWLDIEAMRDAARRFEGLHDFRNFCKVDSSKLIDNFSRRVYESDVVEVEDGGSAVAFLGRDGWRDGAPPPPPDDDASNQVRENGGKFPRVYYLHVRGSAFLWHQIRCMVAVLLNVGQGLEEPSIVDELLDVEKHPRRPNYVLASDTPLVLWDCIFPAESLAGGLKEEQQPQPQPQADSSASKHGGGETTSSPHPHRRPPLRDAMGWVYVGEENALHQHGSHGLLDGAWALWRERKMDEVLAAQLVDVVSRGPDVFGPQRPLDRRGAPAYAPVTQRVFEGADRPVFAGRHVPILRKKTLPSPREVYDREARRKGYADADAWREVKKRAGAAAAAAAAARAGGGGGGGEGEVDDGGD